MHISTIVCLISLLSLASAAYTGTYNHDPINANCQITSSCMITDKEPDYTGASCDPALMDAVALGVPGDLCQIEWVAAGPDACQADCAVLSNGGCLNTITGEYLPISECQKKDLSNNDIPNFLSSSTYACKHGDGKCKAKWVDAIKDGCRKDCAAQTKGACMLDDGSKYLDLSVCEPLTSSVGTLKYTCLDGDGDCHARWAPDTTNCLDTCPIIPEDDVKLEKCQNTQTLEEVDVAVCGSISTKAAFQCYNGFGSCVSEWFVDNNNCLDTCGTLTYSCVATKDTATSIDASACNTTKPADYQCLNSEGACVAAWTQAVKDDCTSACESALSPSKCTESAGSTEVPAKVCSNVPTTGKEYSKCQVGDGSCTADWSAIDSSMCKDTCADVASVCTTSSGVATDEANCKNPKPTNIVCNNGDGDCVATWVVDDAACKECCAPIVDGICVNSKKTLLQNSQCVTPSPLVYACKAGDGACKASWTTPATADSCQADCQDIPSLCKRTSGIANVLLPIELCVNGAPSGSQTTTTCTNGTGLCRADWKTPTVADCSESCVATPVCVRSSGVAGIVVADSACNSKTKPSVTCAAGNGTCNPKWVFDECSESCNTVAPVCVSNGTVISSSFCTEAKPSDKVCSNGDGKCKAEWQYLTKDCNTSCLIEPSTCHISSAGIDASDANAVAICGAKSPKYCADGQGKCVAKWVGYAACTTSCPVVSPTSCVTQTSITIVASADQTTVCGTKPQHQCTANEGACTAEWTATKASLCTETCEKVQATCKRTSGTVGTVNNTVCASLLQPADYTCASGEGNCAADYAYPECGVECTDILPICAITATGKEDASLCSGSAPAKKSCVDGNGKCSASWVFQNCSTSCESSISSKCINNYDLSLSSACVGTQPDAKVCHNGNEQCVAVWSYKKNTQCTAACPSIPILCAAPDDSVYFDDSVCDGTKTVVEHQCVRGEGDCSPLWTSTACNETCEDVLADGCLAGGSAVDSKLVSTICGTFPTMHCHTGDGKCTAEWVHTTSDYCGSNCEVARECNRTSGEFGIIASYVCDGEAKKISCSDGDGLCAPKWTDYPAFCTDSCGVVDQACVSGGKSLDIALCSGSKGTYQCKNGDGECVAHWLPTMCDFDCANVTTYVCVNPSNGAIADKLCNTTKPTVEFACFSGYSLMTDCSLGSCFASWVYESECDETCSLQVPVCKTSTGVTVIDAKCASQKPTRQCAQGMGTCSTSFKKQTLADCTKECLDLKPICLNGKGQEVGVDGCVGTVPDTIICRNGNGSCVAAYGDDKCDSTCLDVPQVCLANGTKVELTACDGMTPGSKKKCFDKVDDCVATWVYADCSSECETRVPTCVADDKVVADAVCNATNIKTSSLCTNGVNNCSAEWVYTTCQESCAQITPTCQLTGNSKVVSNDICSTPLLTHVCKNGEGNCTTHWVWSNCSASCADVVPQCKPISGSETLDDSACLEASNKTSVKCNIGDGECNDAVFEITSTLTYDKVQTSANITIYAAHTTKPIANCAFTWAYVTADGTSHDLSSFDFSDYVSTYSIDKLVIEKLPLDYVVNYAPITYTISCSKSSNVSNVAEIAIISANADVSEYYNVTEFSSNVATPAKLVGKNFYYVSEAFVEPEHKAKLFELTEGSDLIHYDAVLTYGEHKKTDSYSISITSFGMTFPDSGKLTLSLVVSGETVVTSSPPFTITVGSPTTDDVKNLLNSNTTTITEITGFITGYSNDAAGLRTLLADVPMTVDTISTDLSSAATEISSISTFVTSLTGVLGATDTKVVELATNAVSQIAALADSVISSSSATSIVAVPAATADAVESVLTATKSIVSKDAIAKFESGMALLAMSAATITQAKTYNFGKMGAVNNYPSPFAGTTSHQTSSKRASAGDVSVTNPDSNAKYSFTFAGDNTHVSVLAIVNSAATSSGSFVSVLVDGISNSTHTVECSLQEATANGQFSATASSASCTADLSVSQILTCTCSKLGKVSVSAVLKSSSGGDSSSSSFPGGAIAGIVIGIVVVIAVVVGVIILKKKKSHHKIKNESP